METTEDGSSPKTVPGDGAVDFAHLSVLSNISLYDQKASLLLAFDSVLVIFCIQSLAATLSPGHGIGTIHLWSEWLALAAAVSFFLSSSFALATVFPRTRGSRDDYLFWGSSAMKLPVEEFIRLARDTSPDSVMRGKWRHVHILGGICRSKGRWFRLGLLTAMFAFLILILVEVERLWPGTLPGMVSLLKGSWPR